MKVEPKIVVNSTVPVTPLPSAGLPISTSAYIDCMDADAPKSPKATSSVQPQDLPTKGRAENAQTKAKQATAALKTFLNKLNKISQATSTAACAIGAAIVAGGRDLAGKIGAIFSSLMAGLRGKGPIAADENASEPQALATAESLSAPSATSEPSSVKSTVSAASSTSSASSQRNKQIKQGVQAIIKERKALENKDSNVAKPKKLGFQAKQKLRALAGAKIPKENVQPN